MSESAQFTSAIDHSVPGLKKLIKNHLKFSLARDTQTASRRDWWLATSKAAQSLIIERMLATQTANHRTNAKQTPHHPTTAKLFNKITLQFPMRLQSSNSHYRAAIIE